MVVLEAFTKSCWHCWNPDRLDLPFERQDMEAARRHAREIQEDVLIPGDKVWLERVLYELDQDRS